MNADPNGFEWGETDALGNPIQDARPNDQTYNAVLRSPWEAWGDQRAMMAGDYEQAAGGPTEERGIVPMQRGTYVGNPEEPQTDREKRVGNLG